MADFVFTSDAAHGIPIPVTAHPRVSVLIVTYRTGEVLLESLSALVASTDPAVTPYEVIVVDNDPGTATRETVQLLQACTSGVKVLVNAENRGFGGANNQGAELAVGEYLALCNPDLIVRPGWLEPLIAALDDPLVGIAGPPLLNVDGTLQEAGQILYNDGLTAPRLPGEPIANSDVDYLSGACWLVRSAQFRGLGGFDPAFHPAYFEDVDYALRVQERGQVSRLVAAVPVVHLHGQSGDGAAPTWVSRSHQTLVGKWAERLAEQPAWPPKQDPVNSRAERGQRRLWRLAAILTNRLKRTT